MRQAEVASSSIGQCSPGVVQKEDIAAAVGRRADVRGYAQAGGGVPEGGDFARLQGAG